MYKFNFFNTIYIFSFVSGILQKDSFNEDGTNKKLVDMYFVTS